MLSSEGVVWGVWVGAPVGAIKVVRTTNTNLKEVEYVRANELMEEVEFRRTTPNDPSFLESLRVVGRP